MPKIDDSSDEAEYEEEEVASSEGRKRRASRGAVSYNDDYSDSEEEEEEEDNSDDDDDDDEDGSDDDEEEEEDNDDDDDDDDDIPLAALKSQPPAKKKKTAAKMKTKTSKAKTKNKTPAKKKAATKSTASNSINNDYSSPSFALYGTESIKGKLIQNLLCRWWYAITWPDPSAIPKKPPPDYDAMDGFPGVYICTDGDEVGMIKDFRDKENTPCFNNFAKKSSEELKELLVKAINEQKRQLVKSEGGGTTTEKELNTMLKWATKINAKKADTEAGKVLKANKLSIPEN